MFICNIVVFLNIICCGSFLILKKHYSFNKVANLANDSLNEENWPRVFGNDELPRVKNVTGKKNGVVNKQSMTSERLQILALRYCQKYSSISKKKLTDYLKNRLYKDVFDKDIRSNFIEQDIPRIVTKFDKSGLISDKDAASAKLRQQLRSGYSPQRSVQEISRNLCMSEEAVETELPAAMRETILIELNSLRGNEQGEIKNEEEVFEDGDDDIKKQCDDIFASGADMARLALKRSSRGHYRNMPLSPSLYQRDYAWLLRRGYSFKECKVALEGK